VFSIVNPFGAEPAPGRGPHVADYLPTELEGWEVENKRLGATEAVEDRAEQILDLEDFVYRQYSREGTNEFFEVYVAYWSPGRAAINEVSAHTPDRCWTKNGWELLDREHKVEREVDGKRLLPSEWRQFEIEGNEQFVCYWHLVGGESYRYGDRTNAFPTPVSYVRDFLQSHLFGTGEQYFIRINSNVPFDQLWEDARFREVVASVSGLGLKIEPEEETAS